MKKINLGLILGYVLFSCFTCEKEPNDKSNFSIDTLQGTWFLKEFVDKDSVNSYTLPNNYSASISFNGDSCIVIFGPCNSGQGTYYANSNEIIIDNISLTERGCEILDYEETFTTNLSGEYFIDNKKLKIVSDYETDLLFEKSDTAILYFCN